jgi:Tol biopolymer transport system component
MAARALLCGRRSLPERAPRLRLDQGPTHPDSLTAREGSEEERGIMNKRLMSVVGAALTLAAAVAGLSQGSGAAAQGSLQSSSFADPAFQRVWTRTDQLVALGQAGRSWFWGPQPNASRTEPLLESPNGSRLVQYFDKSRMEINNPSGNPNDPFYVTNGLLTVELISGNMQIGASAYSPRYPACIPIAGDSDDPNAPTYASFRTVASAAPGMGRLDPDKRGQVATGTIDRNGTVGTDPTKSSVSGASYVYYVTNTQHNIPEVFWNFLNQQGPVIENGQTVTRQLIVPWFYASGYPISDAYWARVKVAGAFHDVLIQAFERRVLTYNPANNAAFQVEMGNIGLHYFDWRYNNAGVCPAGTGTPVATSTPAGSITPVGSGTPVATGTAVSGTPSPSTTPPTFTPTATSTPSISSGKIAWVTKRVGGKRQIWQMSANGFNPAALTTGTDVENYDPAFSPDGNFIAFVSTRDGNPEIYTMTISGTKVTRLTNNAAADTHPAWSPDSKKIAFASDRATNNDVWVMNADGSGLINITVLPGNDRDPSWGSNDRIAFVSNRTGNDEIYAANPDGTALTQLTNSPGKDWSPAWSPAGNRLLFVSDRDGGRLQIFAMKADGSAQNKLTDLPGDQYDPAWSPGGQYMTFASTKDSNLEIYVSSIDGSNLGRVTLDAADDAHPVWH